MLSTAWSRIRHYWNPLEYPDQAQAAASGTPPRPPLPGSVTAPPTPRRKDVPRYPPFDEGLEIDEIDDILESQQEIIHRIQLSSGMDDKKFGEFIMPIIRNFAEYVHQLPATKDENHMGAGGLFSLGLNVGFYSYQASDGVMFSGRESTEKRRSLEPVWRYASLVAGICSDIYRPLTDVIVVDVKGMQWPAEEMPLYVWAKNNNVERYFLRWVENVNSASAHSAASLVVNKIVPAHCMRYICGASPAILPVMMDTIIDRPGVQNTLHQLVSNARYKVIERDAKESPTRYGKLTVGMHLEPHLISAMRRLLASGEWQVNQRKARVWHGSEGTFIVWKTAAAEIVDLLNREKTPGIPPDPETLADILLRAGVFEAHATGSAFWTIFSPFSSGALEVIKLANGGLLFDGDAPPFVDTSLLLPGPSVPAGSSEEQDDQPVAPAPISTTSPPPAAAAARDPAPVPAKPQSKAPAVQTFPSPAQPDSAHQPKGGAAKPKATPSEAARGALLRRLTPLNREALLAVIEDYQLKKNASDVFMIQHGLAITLKELGSHGADAMRIIGDLDAAKWLWLDPNADGAKFTTIPRDGVDMPCVVLESKIVTILGI